MAIKSNSRTIPAASCSPNGAHRRTAFDTKATRVNLAEHQGGRRCWHRHVAAPGQRKTASPCPKATNPRQARSRNGRTPSPRTGRKPASRPSPTTSRHDQAASEAALLWQAASETGVSPYLIRKGVQPYGVRFASDGCVLVPLIDASSKLWTCSPLPHRGPPAVH